MKKINNSDLEKKDEIMVERNKDQINQLSAHTNILQINKDIFININKSKSHIQLNNCSFNKIISLSNIALKNYIKFKSSKELSDTDSDNESTNSLKGMAKLKERLYKEDHNDKRNINKTYFNNKYHLNITKEDKSSIGTNYELYKMTWKNLYKWLLLFPLTIIFGLIIFIYKDSHGFTLAEFFCFFIIFLICIVSMNGNEKMLAKKKVNFKYENSLLFLICLLCFYIIICANTNMVEYIAYNFLSKYYFLTHVIFFTLIIFCFVLIYLNKKMVGFYHKYSQIINSGVLLTDRS